MIVCRAFGGHNRPARRRLPRHSFGLWMGSLEPIYLNCLLVFTATDIPSGVNHSGRTRSKRHTPGTQGGVILDTLFGEGQTGPKILLFLVSGARPAGRGVLAAAAVRWRAAGQCGDARPAAAPCPDRPGRDRQPPSPGAHPPRTMWSICSSSADRPTSWSNRTSCARPPRLWRRRDRRRRTRCRAPFRSARTPCGRCSRKPAPKPEGRARSSSPVCVLSRHRGHHVPGPKNRCSGQGDAEAPAAPSVAPLPPAAPRKPRPVDPLAGLAEELSRIPPPPTEPAGLEPAPDCASRAAAAGWSPAAPTEGAPPPSDPESLRWRNGWRPRCVVRPSPLTSRPTKPVRRAEDARSAAPASGPALEDFAPPPASRLGAALRRPFKTDDTRASPFAPKTAGEPTGAGDGGIRARARRAAFRRHSAAPVQAR